MPIDLVLILENPGDEAEPVAPTSCFKSLKGESPVGLCNTLSIIGHPIDHQSL